jgi:hypothetical protein
MAHRKFLGKPHAVAGTGVPAHGVRPQLGVADLGSPAPLSWSQGERRTSPDTSPTPNTQFRGPWGSRGENLRCPSTLLRAITGAHPVIRHLPTSLFPSDREVAGALVSSICS